MRRNHLAPEGLPSENPIVLDLDNHDSSTLKTVLVDVDVFENWNFDVK
jgi:hypothetical protein